jgi:hypothetical protein
MNGYQRWWITFGGSNSKFAEEKWLEVALMLGSLLEAQSSAVLSIPIQFSVKLQ